MLPSTWRLSCFLICVLLAVTVVKVGFFWDPIWTSTLPQRPLPSNIPVMSSPKELINNSQEFTPPEVFKERKEVVEDICAKRSKDMSGGIGGIFTDTMARVIYCFVPKTGCTFWKQMFQFKLLQVSHKFKSPWSIPRSVVHFNEYKRGFHYDKDVHSATNYPTRLLVSRNPFSRLLSSYLDKIYLPDFWDQVKHFAKSAAEYKSKNNGKLKRGKNIKKDFLRSHFDNMASKLEPVLYLTSGNTTKKYLRCPKFVTFAEFIRASIEDNEPHWMPIHTLCNPCMFKPTHISKMETFTQDARVILKSMNMDQFLDEFDKDQQVARELQMIIDYNFDRFSAGKDHCLNSYTELAYRLWNNFIWRGYIHPHVVYIPPNNLTKEYTKEDLIAQVKDARELGRKEPNIMRKAKHDFLMAAYGTLNKKLFEKVVSKFRMDFELFGYSGSLKKIRSELFPTQNSAFATTHSLPREPLPSKKKK